MHFISFISILGWTLFLSTKAKKNISFFPSIVVATIISILYLGSLIGILQYTSWFILFCGITLPIYSALKNELTFKSVKNMPVSFFILAVLGGIWFLFTINAVIFGADEFAWGQFTKVIVNTNALYNKTSAIMQGKLNYPPGIALFQYFFMSFGRYSEPAVFFAQGIFVFACITPIFDLASRNLKKILVFALTTAMSLVYFGPGLLSMTNDHIIAVIFASAIIANYFVLKTNRSKLLLIPVIFCLPLLKTTGILLSLTIVLAVTIEILITNSRYNGNKLDKKLIFKAVGVLLIMLFFTALSVKSWDSYIKRQGTEPTPIPSVLKIAKSFTNKASEREKTVLRNFKKDLISRPINIQEGDIKSDISIYKTYLYVIEKINLPRLGTLAWSLIFSGLFTLIIYCQKRKNRVVAASRFLSLLVGLIIYVFFHLLAYLYFFSDYEAFKLAAMDRYFSSYFLSLSLIAIGMSSALLKENPPKAKFFGQVTGIFLIYLLIFHTPMLVRLIVPPKMMAASTQLVRDKTTSFSNEINDNTEENSKIWVIYQNTKGWECMMIRYDIVPRTMNGGSGNWSLGDKYGPNDVWTNSMEKETWSSQLLDEHYNYVFLAYADENFWNHHGEIFEDPVDAKAHKLFRVTQRENRVVLVAK